VVYKLSTDLTVTKTKVKLQSDEEAKAIEDKDKAKKFKELKAKLDKERENKPEQGVILLPDNSQISYTPKCDDEEIVDSEIIVPQRDLGEYIQLMNLQNGDMATIIHAIGRTGCMMCDGDVDIEDGFLWHTNNKQVMCMRCGNYFPDYQELIYIDEDAYMDIEEEFGEHEGRYE
jgi:hypothetical protein